MQTENSNIVFYIIIVCVIVFSFLTIALVLFVAIFQKRKLKQQAEIMILNEKFSQILLQTQIEIQTQTLQTISQEIHDNVGQVLSLAKLNLNTFEDTENEFNKARIRDTKQLVSKAITDLRDLSRSLYGNKVAELGLPEAISNELQILQNSGQFKTELTVTGEPYKLEPQKEMVIFRILQESLNNAIKHSKAQLIKVLLEYDPGSFRLTVNDDGVGFDASAFPGTEAGMGLKSMQSRATLVGGAFSVISSAKKGTSVTITIKGTVL